MSEKLTVNEAAHGAWGIVALAGRMDVNTSSAVETAGLAVLNKDAKLALDMSELAYISSAGLRILARLLKKSEANGQSIAIVNANGVVKDMLEYCGLDTLFSLYKSVDELP